MDKRTSTNGNKVLGYIAKRIAVRDANTTLDCRSINRTNSAIQSRIASISPSYLSSSALYYSNAPSGQTYYMTTSASVSYLRVKGRYTP